MADFSSMFGDIGSLVGNVQGMQGASKIGSFLNNAGSEQQYTPGYAQQLNQLMSNPSSITSTPGFQFGMNQAESQVQHGLAAQGLIGGGTMAGTMANTGAAYAGQQLSQQEQLLSQLSGANFNPAQMADAMGTNNQSKANSTSSAIGDVGGLALGAVALGF